MEAGSAWRVTSATFDGLHARNWQDMMDQMVEVGDTIRLPFSLQNVQPGAMPRAINYGLNPDPQGCPASASSTRSWITRAISG